MSDRPDILLYTRGLNATDFYNDKKTRDAVERNLEIIGEAANRLPEEIYLKYNAVEWYRIISLRNRLIHAYFSIKKDIIWNVIVQYLPQLKIKLEQLLKEF